MVTKKKIETDSWEIPRVRIESRELLNILESLNATSEDHVTAETSGHKFESLEDIKKNIELLKGDIEIEIGPIQINLTDGFMRGVRVRWGARIEESNSAEAYAERFIERISAYKVLFSDNIKKSVVALFGALSFSYYFMMPQLTNNLPNLPAQALLAVATLVYWSLFYSLIGYFFKNGSPVYFAARDSFWSRNSDKIIVGIIMLLSGILISRVLDYFS